MKIGDRVRTIPREGVVVSTYNGSGVREVKFDGHPMATHMGSDGDQLVEKLPEVTVTLTEQEAHALAYPLASPEPSVLLTAKLKLHDALGRDSAESY